jgi:hypothetical protein
MGYGPKDSGDGHWSRLDDLLLTSPVDPGCSVSRRDVDVYAELTLDGGAPAARFPGVAAHLESCAECREDVEGLIAALRDTADRDPWPDSSGPARGR